MALKKRRFCTMGMKIRYLAGRRVGDLYRPNSSASYVAGQVLMLQSDGTVAEMTQYTGSPGDDGGTLVGFALGHAGSANDIYSDIYNGKCAVLVGRGNVVELNASDPENGSDDYPYDTALTYDYGDLLYVDTNGKLSNSTPGTGDVPADSLPVAFVVAPPSAYTIQSDEFGNDFNWRNRYPTDSGRMIIQTLV